MHNRGQSYRKRFGSSFKVIAEVLIDAVMPLCAPVVRYHFGLTDEKPPPYMSLHATRWLEGMAKGHLEGALNQISQIERYGGTHQEMKATLLKRSRRHAPLRALFLKFQELQRVWLSEAALRFGAKIPYVAPDKLALNYFLIQWTLSACDEIEYLQEEELEVERDAVKTWVIAVVEMRWLDALKALEEVHAPKENTWERYSFYYLSDAVRATIYGRWAWVHSILNYAYEQCLDAEEQAEEQTQNHSQKTQELKQEITSEEPSQTHQEDDEADIIDGLSFNEFQVPDHVIENEAEMAYEEDDIFTGPLDPLSAKSYILTAFAASEAILVAVTPEEQRYTLGMEDVLGTRQWQLMSPLGEQIWKVIDASGNLGVLEEIWPVGSDAWMQETQKEALALNQIQHDHIAPIQDWGIDPKSGRWFLVYPFIYGENLVERIAKQGPLSEAQARAYFLQILDALKKSVRHNVFHRQLRPENIIFYSDEQIVLTRFGVHRNRIPLWKTSFDMSTSRRNFIAPESFEEGDSDARSEVFSLGSLIKYALLADDGDIQDLPIAYQPLVMKATDPNPEERYPSLSAFERALRDLKTLYNYRGEFGERDAIALTQVVALILTKPKGLHSIWQPHLKEWKVWKEIDEIEQVVTAALKQQEIEAKLNEDGESDEYSDTKSNPSTPKSPRKSIVKKPPLNPIRRAVQRKRPTTTLPPSYTSTPEKAGTLHTITIKNVPFHMCYIPHGDFLMGFKSTDPGVSKLERPQHVVSIRYPLLFAQVPVTQGMYAAITGENPSYFQGWRRPVEQITWFEAAQFCNLLSKIEGLPLAYLFEEDLVDELGLLANEAHYNTEEESTKDSQHDQVLSKADEKQSTQIPTIHEIDFDQELEENQSALESFQSLADQEQDLHTLYKEEQKSSTPSEISLHAENSNLDLMDSYEDSQKQDSIGSTDESEVDQETENSEVLAKLLEDADDLDHKRRRIRIQKVEEGEHRYYRVRFNLYGGGYRMPTEAEWEYVAKSSNDFAYSGSEQWKDVTWCNVNTREITQPVAQLKANNWGVFDMSGNVWEWCSDDLRIYTRSCIDPHFQAAEDGESEIKTRAIRGGSWRDAPAFSKVTTRMKVNPEQRREHIGFRIVRALPPIRIFEDPSEEEL